MRLTFLGVAGFLSDGFQSNMLLDIDNGKTLLLDCGTDIKHSLKAANRKVDEIDAVYISHLHGDHMGGLEWLAFYTYFVTKKKIDLLIHESLLSDLWSMVSPSMSNHKGKYLKIDDYFNVKTFGEKKISFSFDVLAFQAIRLRHVAGKYQNLYSYALMADNSYTINGKEGLFYISFDTDEIIRHQAKYIFYDCDVMNLDGVHPNYKDLKEIEGSIKKKMWLYHYTDLGADMPDAVADGFAGFVKQGQIFDFSIGEKVKEALRDGPNSEDFKPGILKEKDKYVKWGSGHSDAFGSPGYVETIVKRDTKIYPNNNRDKPFSSEGLGARREEVKEERTDGL